MDWMIYGANGYTGELIAREAKKQGAVPVLAGRNAAKIAQLARDLSLHSKVFSLCAPTDAMERPHSANRLGAVAAALAGVGLVLNCAGPFSKTADVLMQACLAVKVHYLDVTGEIDVLEDAHRFDTDAKTAGVVLCPGVGFDVTPTDCIALMLKTALPEAEELALGFESNHRMSAGTAKTLVEALGKSGKIRRGGPDRRPSHRPWMPRGRFRPRPKAGDAHSVGRRRLSLLHHGHSQHHCLHASLFADHGNRANDQRVWLHFAIASRSELARRENRENCEGAGYRGA